MIKSTDLRLGNLVNLRGHITKVQQLGLQRCMALEDFAEYEDLEPIQLDEKRLLELGFILTEVKRNKFMQTTQERIDKTYELNPYAFDETGNIKIEVIKDSKDIELRRIGIYGADLLDLISIKYLHTFQNICHSLYNQDLTIKED